MNKIMIFISIVVFIVLVNLGISAKAQVNESKSENYQLQAKNLDMKQMIKYKESLLKEVPVPISTEYIMVLNQIRLLENYSGTSMNVQLDGATDSQDISSHYENTEYKGIRGLKIKIVVNRFSKDTDMGIVLDDINLLEKNTDFMVSEIGKDNNNLTVKGEVYGF